MVLGGHVVTYRSKTTYQALQDTVENADALAEWGYYNPMEPAGLWIVFDERNQMVSAVVSPDDFDDLFEEIPPEETPPS